MTASRSISKSEFLSSLPPWRRFLAKLNWHPTIDAQIRAIESRQESERLRNETTLLKNESVLVKNETEQVKNETEQLRKETEQLRNETEQVRKETELLRIENARLAKLESKLDLLFLNADSSSQIPPATDCN